jgi:hypothetical protein
VWVRLPANGVTKLRLSRHCIDDEAVLAAGCGMFGLQEKTGFSCMWLRDMQSCAGKHHSHVSSGWDVRQISQRDRDIA